MEVSVVPKTSASTDSPWLGLAKYAWSGWVLQRRCLLAVLAVLPWCSGRARGKVSSLCRYVIECPNCGVVYRSRQYWFGNQDPVNTVVRTEIEHVWPGVSLLAGWSLCMCCSHARANLALLDVDGEKRSSFIKLVPAVWKNLCKGLQTSFGYLETAKLPTYSCLSKQGWWIFFSCLPFRLTGVMGCRAICI